jgi:hypothetical protein
MSPHLIGLLIPAVAILGGVLMIVGFPTMAFVAFRFFRFKEREIALDAQYRESSLHQQLALEQRVESLEQVLGALDHDVRQRLLVPADVTGREHFDSQTARSIRVR